MNPPPQGYVERSGIVRKDNEYYAWSHLLLEGSDITVMAPMGADQLSRLVPNLGTAELLPTHPTRNRATVQLQVGKDKIEVEQAKSTSAQLPPPMFRFDSEVAFPALRSIYYYDDPGKDERTLLYVNSRLSAVYNVLFSGSSDNLQVLWPILLAITSAAFLIVEIVSLITGITMTRTITSAVHHLYAGTQHVIQGDFSHRIQVKGHDQLSDLGHSFNSMTKRIEELLAVAKEKERLQSEIEIASEVQNQLYPKNMPDVQSLRLTAVCKPARMVSGDYFDYDCIRDNKVSLAIGDVAGKGISAALLMATLQSALRTELRNTAAGLALAAGNGSFEHPISTSKLVGHLNEQLYANTSPEKYATFYLGIFDEQTSILRYTNAGHLPPILVRNGEATRVECGWHRRGGVPVREV